MTISTMTLSITAPSIMTESCCVKFHLCWVFQISSFMLSVVMLNVIMLSVVAPYNEQAATAIVVCVEPSRDETRRDRECKNRDSAISSNCAFSNPLRLEPLS